MWKLNQKDEWEFTGGRDAFATAAEIAGQCPAFRSDDEDELVADEPVSCYNCRFRRWTARSFACYGKRNNK